MPSIVVKEKNTLMKLLFDSTHLAMIDTKGIKIFFLKLYGKIE